MQNLKCFSVVSAKARSEILREFNAKQTYNEQNAYLSGLISLIPIQRRRPRKTQNLVDHFKQSSYKYRVRVLNDEGISHDLSICYKAFLSIYTESLDEERKQSNVL